MITIKIQTVTCFDATDLEPMHEVSVWNKNRKLEHTRVWKNPDTALDHANLLRDFYAACGIKATVE